MSVRGSSLSLRSLLAGLSARPRVLFSHIPLFRLEGTPCGRERESANALRQGAGKNYQNELDEITTRWIIEVLKPTIVYSGDDHDSCVINHPYFAPQSGSPVVETTVKAFVSRLAASEQLDLISPLSKVYGNGCSAAWVLSRLCLF